MFVFIMKTYNFIMFVFIHIYMYCMYTDECIVNFKFRFLEVCLRLWERTKEGYEELRDAGFMKLPSGRHLRYIKNK